MCAGFVDLELSLVGGAAVTPERASKTWQRVRKEKARLAALEAKAEAERAFQRARDPRRNMPSRFTRSFPAPLADRQPLRVDVRPLPPPPKAVAEVRSGLTVMPGGSVLTGRAGGKASRSAVHCVLRGGAHRPASVHCSGGASALGPAGVQRGAANTGDDYEFEGALRVVDTRSRRWSEQSDRQGITKAIWQILIGNRSDEVSNSCSRGSPRGWVGRTELRPADGAPITPKRVSKTSRRGGPAASRGDRIGTEWRKTHGNS